MSAMLNFGLFFYFCTDLPIFLAGELQIKVAQNSFLIF